MRLRPGLIPLFALALTVAACGAGDEGSATTQANETPADNGGTAVSGDSDGSAGDAGTGAASASGDLPTSVPDDFPIAIPAGWEIDIHAELGLTSGATQLLYSEDAFEDVIAFYDEWTESQGDEYTRTESGDLIIYTRSETPVYQIAVTRNHQERDQTWTLLQAAGSAGDG